MLSKRVRRAVSSAVLTIPVLCIAVAAGCYSPWVISKEDLRAGKYPPAEQLRLTYPSGWVILRNDWTLDYPRAEGIVDEMSGTVPSYEVAKGSRRQSFNLDDATKIEIYDFDRKKTAIAVGVPGGVLAMMVILVIIMLGATVSCPNVYVYNGPVPVLVGEAYPGATFRPLAADDFLQLPSEVNGTNLRVEIRNEHPETQYIDHASLTVVRHSARTRVVSSGDRLYVASAGIGPAQARDRSGRDVVQSIMRDDGAPWEASLKQIAQASEDFVEASFEPTGPDPHILIIRAENTRWHDMVLGRFFESMGDGYRQFLGAANRASGSELAAWREREGLTLRVEKRENSSWRNVGSIAAAGTAGYRSFAVPINLSEAQPLKLRILAGTGFWRIDSLSIARIVDDTPQTESVAPYQVSSDEPGAAATLARIDGKTHRMTDIGESLGLFFSVPDAAGSQRSLFLRTRGHYEVQTLRPNAPAAQYALTDRGVLAAQSRVLVREWQKAAEAK